MTWTWTWTRARRDWFLALGVGGAVAVGWGLSHRMLLGEQRLADPLSYGGDAMLALGEVAAARRGDFLPFFSKELPSLGAPFVASWNDWPISEDVLYWLLGLVARGTGTVAAINLGYLAACVTAAMSFFFVARRFALSRETAALGAVLFGLSNYIAIRGVSHYSLTFVWVVPWNVLVCSWLSSRRGLPFGSRRFALAAVTTVGTAWGFVYYSFFAAQLFVLGTVAGAVRYGWSKQRLKPAVRGRHGPAVAWAGLGGWLVAAHSVGGLNSLLFLLDVRLFRSTNRASVVILAVALLFGGQLLGKMWSRRPSATRWAIAAVLAVGGAWEQLPLETESIADNHRVAEADRELVARMEQVLDPSSMVFELPAMDFPEVLPTLGVESYEQFRPTLYATSLRFSHGDVKGRKNPEWKFRVAALPAEQMVAQLKEAKFSAVYLNRKGYADRGAELERALLGLGCRVIAVSALQDTVAYAL